MVRAGRQKVRTGCYTCKIRKVKCDETKPACLRCTKTGRRCDGYPAAPLHSQSWQELLAKRPIIPAVTHRHNSQEGRALEFYRCVLAPTFSGSLVDDFWTHVVSRASYQNPVIRHAVVAISSICELIGDPSVKGQSLVKFPKGRYAIGHYNRALQDISKTDDEAMVIFVCILFVCIEILQGNREAAISHCHHGVQILNQLNGGKSKVNSSSSILSRDQLLNPFARLSIFPFFYGSTVDVFPNLLRHGSEAPDSSDGTHGGAGTATLASDSALTVLDELRSGLDLLVARAMRFLRSADLYRIGPSRHEPVPSQILTEQANLTKSIDDWLVRFTIFSAVHSPTEDAAGLFYQMRMKSYITKIWIATALDRTEMVYDRFVPLFREIVDMAGRYLAAEKSRPRGPSPPRSASAHASGNEEGDGGGGGGPAFAATNQNKPRFVYEMAYLPMLYFVVMRCRHLETRVKALEHMTTLSALHQGLWDSTLTFCIGWRLIEIEHGADRETLLQSMAQAKGTGTMQGSGLGMQSPSRLSNSVTRLIAPDVNSLVGRLITGTMNPPMPPDRMRLRECVITGDHTVEQEEEEQEQDGKSPGSNSGSNSNMGRGKSKGKGLRTGYRRVIFHVWKPESEGGVGTFEEWVPISEPPPMKDMCYDYEFAQQTAAAAAATVGNELGEVKPSFESGLVDAKRFDSGYVEAKPTSYNSGFVETAKPSFHVASGYVGAKPSFTSGFVEAKPSYGNGFVEVKPSFNPGFVDLGRGGGEHDLPTRTMPPVYDGLKLESVV
ncbi:hypothetical protein SMACR_04771 [Sordaria macrospora]|uniref:WGS project CABT00000000 data, contig 2.21 n=2 Tax=Sordaria macrospora TaxID=5147 RepID=F7W2D9_SORMK|nr:uncharacterized protein SMAC_04771 [Sordaria macrospora k-hell]KAA8636712.1 hypothetical protein SMACR_04771 [Sordaria macrospora]WPJ62044.1 hypothetical protein SMAC4_04771 [Sordaria macrospora]CCC11789.1 unnamed protein product [Sordaria macrospora k-hell]